MGGEEGGGPRTVRCEQGAYKPDLVKAAREELDFIAFLPCICHMEHHHSWHLKPAHCVFILSIAWQDAKACGLAVIIHKR